MVQMKDHVICYKTTMITTNGVWQGDNPLSFSLPLLMLQIVLVVVTTRILVFLLKPFNQPRVLAEILGGIILGPSVLGRFKALGANVFPQRSLLTLETVAHVGLLFFLFIVGVEMDAMVIRRSGRKALVIAVAGMVVPFIIGTATSFVFRHFVSKNIHQASFLLFLGVALSVTAFPVLARILAEIKLLNTEIGRLSMSAAVINDMCAWILLALSIALTDTDGNALSSLWVLLCGVAFVLLCFYGVRPVMWWFMRRIPEGQPVSDFHVCLVLSGVMLAGLATDAIGIHAVFGAFVFGLVVPNGQLGVAIVEKLGDLVTGILLPLFFVISGLRTDLSKVNDVRIVGLLILVFVLASIGKVAGTVLLALLYAMPLREGLALGFLMNTRGLVEMIILNIGRDKQVLDDESFSVMVLVSLVMTALVTPAVTYLHRPTRRLVGYKRRNLQRASPNAELRMLACVHNTRNVPSILKLLDISNPTKRSPIFVYALHLVELSGRASAMLIVHNSAANSSTSGTNTYSGHRCKAPSSSITSTQAQSEHIIQAFEAYDQQAGGVSIQTLTTISPYPTMHEDICSLAEDKHVALIILPFHKQQTVDGGMDTINQSIKALNHNVLKCTPCSVGILIDRGLSNTTRMGERQYYHVALLFFGGPDDREALAYAWRMVEHSQVHLTVVRFIPIKTETSISNAQCQDSRVVTVVTDSTHEKQLDDEYINEFRLKNVSNESMIYTEKIVSDTEDTLSAIRAMESIHDLYIVGRGKDSSRASTVTSGLSEFAECPELGPIGDLLASSDFATTVSVLVVQQYVIEPDTIVGNVPDNGVDMTVQQYLQNANQNQRRAAAQPTMVAGTQRGSVSLSGGWNVR